MRRSFCVLLFLVLLPALPSAVHAGAAEVCDLPPRFGMEATAAAIVRTACQEHRQWLQPFIEPDGRLAALGVTEAERTRLFDGITPAWQRVVQYWRESGTLSSMLGTPGAASCLYPSGGREVEVDCRAFLVDNPWSAAFVSWVMVRAPLPGFPASARHLDYIAYAWRHPESSPYLYTDPFAGKPAPGDLLCFLRAADHDVGPVGLRQALSGQGRMPTRSHCEIVVGANPGGDHTLYLIGGNVLNSVVMRKLPLDPDGHLLPAALGTTPVPVGITTVAPVGSDDRYAAEESATPIDTSACTPERVDACSFNRRDWAVLLKLKPQVQLRTGIPAMPQAPAEASPAPGPAAPPRR